MMIKKKKLEISLFIILALFSVFINNIYGNIGIFPIDSFAFFDTAYNILLNKHPFKDFWVTTGPLVDYIQAFFFKLFGLTWSSYVLHASIFNLIISLSLFSVLNKYRLNIYLCFFYSVSFSILCYPISGTPFAYIHSYVLSLISILIFTLCIKTKVNLFWFFLPFSMVAGFLCMQIPSTYINLILIFFLLFYFFNNFSYKNFLIFISGSIVVLLFFLFYLFYFKIPILNFIQQYFLFPISMAEYRLEGIESEPKSLLSSKLTFRSLVGHFKFINIFLVLIIFLTFLNYSKKFKNFLSKEEMIINFVLIFSTLAFIFNQLITYNQTFIFSLIPFLAAFSHISLKKYFLDKKIINIFILLLVTFVTFKYHNVYNVKRKFMDLQNVDLSKYEMASLIDPKFGNLKWISPAFSKDPKKEISLIKTALDKIKNDERNKMLITHYNFFQTILDQDLNIPNRWYTSDNNSYPLKNHKYYNFYKKHLIRHVEKNNIEVIYIVGDQKIENFLIYMDNICVQEEKINEISMIYKLKKC